MAERDLADCLREIIDEAGGEGSYMCALCYRRLPTREAKTEHMECAHGYETLHLTYIPPE